MKIDWTQELHEIGSEVIPETKLVGDQIVIVTRKNENGEDEPKPLTLGRACITALLAEFQGDNETGAQKFDRGQLAYDIANGDGEMTIKQLDLIQERIGKRYGALLVWQIWNMLEGKDG